MNATSSKRIERLQEIHEALHECSSQKIKADDLDRFAEIILNTKHESKEAFHPSNSAERKEIVNILNQLIKTIGQNKSVILAAAGAASFTKLEESLNAGLQHFANEQEKEARIVSKSQKSKEL